MFDVITSSFTNLLFSGTLLYLFLGVGIGLLVGVLPALGTTAALALVVPFVYGMDMMAGVAMMTGLLAVVATGDVFTSILMGMPGGGSGSQATVIDGFPMTKKGQGARALSAAFTASLLGGLFGAVVLTGAILVARPVVLAFGIGELLLLTLLGVTLVSVLSGPSLAKGLIACGLGLLMGAVGGASATAELRMIVGNFDYLADGIPLAAVALGVFALPEIITLLRRGETIAEQRSLGGGWLQGLKDTIEHKWLVLRCSIIGAIIGALPIGGAEWFAYGHAVQTCKPRDNFGKGDVRGVIAPEAANNANAGGALIPTLIFGIPGSGSTAIFLAGLVLLGIRPGPNMVGSNLEVTYTIIWSLALANVIGTAVCFLISGQLAKIATIRFVYIAPILLAVILFGAFQSSRQWGDLWILFVVGIFGIYMKRFGYSRPAFMIGFVLSGYIEKLMYQTMQVYTPEKLFSRPLIWALIIANIVSLFFGLRSRPTIETEGKSHQATAADLRPQIVFLLLIAAIVLYVIYDTYDMVFLSKVFPITVAAIVLGIIAYGLFVFQRRDLTNPFIFDLEIRWAEHTDGFKTGLGRYVAWVLALLGFIYVFGFMIGVAAFFVSFMIAEAKLPLWKIGIVTGSVVGVLTLFSHFLVVDFPGGLIQQWFDLPWPIN